MAPPRVRCRPRLGALPNRHEKALLKVAFMLSAVASSRRGVPVTPCKDLAAQAPARPRMAGAQVAGHHPLDPAAVAAAANDKLVPLVGTPGSRNHESAVPAPDERCDVLPGG